MSYPRVLSEFDTLQAAIDGQCLSRFGDGELRIATGGNAISQNGSPELKAELRRILAEPRKNCLVGIPNIISQTPKAGSWQKYGVKQFVDLYRLPLYGSSFITRPDSAPWIDTPQYWDMVRSLWSGKDIVLVTGGHNGIKPEFLVGANSVRTIVGAQRDAFATIGNIEVAIGQPSGSVLICLGATATALAWRLAAKGIHAVDLGHIGMFMKHAGAYRYTVKDLASDSYRKQLSSLHRREKWGADGEKHTLAVKAMIAETGARTVLDYGCGRGLLAESMKPQRVMEYDPGIPGKEGMPKPVDLTVCTDVLEHVEPDKLDQVLDHIYRLSALAAYIVIATRPANAVLPDGRNAHLIVQDAQWWQDKLASCGWRITRRETEGEREARFWLKK